MKKVVYDYGYNVFASKNDLRKKFYKDFYEFLKEKTDFDFSSVEVNNFDEFYAFVLNWDACGKKDLYGPGDALQSYYLTDETDGVVENQPETTFLGYIFKQGKYQDFIHFLPTFFEYWRTDEGCTCYGEDTTDFYFHNWDALVDTLKFFYFTSDTLQDKYVWFKSKRVHKALDEIPSVYKKLKEEDEFEDDCAFVLPKKVKVKGYKFEGWYAEKEFVNKINAVCENTTVYAKLVK